MAFEPNRITKNDVLKAVDTIEKDGIALTPSTGYNVIINNKPYPPKEIMRYAHQVATGEFLWYPGGGEPTNKYLRKLGFEIKEKNEVEVSYANYTWRSLYSNICNKLLDYENNQPALIEILKSAGIEGFNDFDNSGAISLNEIDPFTFFSFIHKTKNINKRLELVRKIANAFDLTDAISDFDGIPTANAQKVWYFPYQKDRQPNDINNLWQLFKQALDENIDEDTFQNCLQIQSVGKAKLTEGLFIVNPDRFLPLNGQTKPYLQFKGISIDFITADNYIKILDKVTQVFNLPFYVVSYQAYLENVKIPFWRIGTSDDEGNSYWEEMVEERTIKIGWSTLGNLANVPKLNRDGIYDLLLQKGMTYNGNNSTVSRKAGEIWAFFKDIKIGDYILAQSGHNILGIGIVEGNYYFDGIDNFPHKRKVNWKIMDANFPQQPEGNRTTVVEITDQLTKNELLQFIENYKEEQTTLNKQLASMISLNQILYGPPGTGKTYNTINHSLAILENTTVEAINADEQNLGRKVINERFESFKQKGFVEFITFHQNYSYEEFVQGLRPALGKDGSEPDNLKFKKVDGIFKKLADEAFKNLVGGEVEQEEELSFQELLSKFLEPLNLSQEIEIDMATAGSKFHVIKEEEKYIEFRNSAGKTAKINKIFLEKAFSVGSLNGIVVGGLISYYAPILNKLNKLKEEAGKQIVPIVPHSYVLIIDEINRANISRVFGELITLLEEDKRWDNEHKLKIKLPSGDEFTVPKNLYIIGTMNTADKSIALLDIALRRRFDFIAMYPNENLVQAEYKVFFIALNKAIKDNRGVDFAIGHSYLMSNIAGKPFNFETAMNKKIIPLLNEYFHSAKEGKVEDIIKNAFLSGGLQDSFELITSPLGMLTIKGK